MVGVLHAQTEPSSPSGRRVTPPAGTWASGFDAGFANPLGDDDFDAEPTFDAYLEYFSTPHVSWRGMLAYTAFDGPDVPGLGTDDVVIASLNANVLYQWEGNAVHPFVTGGVGMYNYDPDLGDSDLEPGLNAGGGMNLYTAERFAIKLEALFHVTDGREPDSYLTGTVGARWLWGGR
jgi:hypothetical protein